MGTWDVDIVTRESADGDNCQELDGSGLLSVSKTVMLWIKGSVR